MGSRSRGGTKHRQNIALIICVNQTISEINDTQRIRVTLRLRGNKHRNEDRGTGHKEINIENKNLIAIIVYNLKNKIFFNVSSITQLVAGALDQSAGRRLGCRLGCRLAC